MSVINKMLRDLDARRASSTVPGREVPGGLTRDTASVKGNLAAGGASVRLRRWLPVALVLGLGLAAAWWFGEQALEEPPLPAKPPQAAGPALGSTDHPASLPSTQASSAVVSPAAVQAAAPLGSPQLNQMLDQAAASPQAVGPLLPPAAMASAPAVSPAQTQQALQQLVPNVPGGKLALPAQLPGLAYELQQQLAKPAASNSAAAPAQAPALPGPLQPVPASTPRAAPVPLRPPVSGRVAVPPAVQPDPRHKGVPLADPMAVQAPAERVAVAPVPEQKATPAATKATATAKPPRSAEPMPMVNPRQAAALEALNQARNLWNAGSRDAALDVMRQAVAVAERAQTAAIEPAALPAFQTLVRELARMELAQGQVSQVLELLVRLEPLLTDQADLWAVRGNAAQRLGRHQDSVHAYGMALKLRPGEPRWLLASAVSLAVQGQLTAAAEQAEKARAAGAVSPEVLAYLRQLGVPLR